MGKSVAIQPPPPSSGVDVQNAWQSPGSRDWVMESQFSARNNTEGLSFIDENSRMLIRRRMDHLGNH